MSMPSSMVSSKIDVRWSLLIWLACLVMVVLLSNCSSPNSAPSIHAPIATCQGIDWYEIGRRDGATGSSLSLLSDYQNQCRKDKNHPDTELYTNGRNAGLVEYCTPQMGLETSRFGHTYAHVCPSHLEKNFLRGFQAGQKVRTLDTENTLLTAQIATLSRSVAAVDGGVESSTQSTVTDNVTGGTTATRNPASVDENHTRLAALRKKHAANDEAIVALEKSAQK